MLHKRRKDINTILSVVSYSNLALVKVSKDYQINKTELEILMCIEAIQKETNRLVHWKVLSLRCGYGRSIVYAALRALASLGYIDIVVNDFYRGCSGKSFMYNVSYAGALIVKYVNMEISRMINSTPNSEWLRIQAQHPALKKFLAPDQGTVDYTRKKDIKKG